jgi:acyl carrier protein
MQVNKKAILAGLASAALLLTAACTSSETASTSVTAQCRPMPLTKGITPVLKNVPRPSEQTILGWISESISIPVEKLQLDSTFDDLSMDSLDQVELVLALEDNWGKSIPDEAAENFRTVGDVVRYIQANS